MAKKKLFFASLFPFLSSNSYKSFLAGPARLSLLFFFSSPFVVVAADGVSKLPSGASSGAFMPFVFGGVHTQKGNYGETD